MNKQLWYCEVCRNGGVVVYQDDEDVLSVCYKLIEAHKIAVPGCISNGNDIRAIFNPTDETVPLLIREAVFMERERCIEIVKKEIEQREKELNDMVMRNEPFYLLRGAWKQAMHILGLIESGKNASKD